MRWEGLPHWIDYQNRQVDLRGKLAKLESERGRRLRQYEEARQEWEAACARALDSGEDQPTPPSALGVAEADEACFAASGHIEQHRAQEASVLASIAEEAEPLWALDLDPLLSESRECVRRLRELRPAIDAIQAARAKVRRAVDRANPNAVPSSGFGTGDRTWRLRSVADLLDLIERDGDLATVLPVPEARRSAIEADHEPTPSMPPGGLSPKGVFGEPPTFPAYRPRRGEI